MSDKLMAAPAAWLVFGAGVEETLWFSESSARSVAATHKQTCAPLYAAPPAAELVKVKPLEWSVNQSAKSACATYYVIPVNGRFGVSLNAMTTIAEHLGFYDTIDEAKAAAQTNYEARILSAIEVEG